MYGSVSFDVYAHENIITIKIMNTFADLPKLPCVRGYLRKQIEKAHQKRCHLGRDLSEMREQATFNLQQKQQGGQCSWSWRGKEEEVRGSCVPRGTPKRLQWVLPQSRHPGLSTEQVNAWDTHQNKVWWQEESGRVFSKQPGSRGEQVARARPSWTGSRKLEEQ